MKETTVTGHYEEHYFNDFQKSYGEFGGVANKFMFEKYIRSQDAVLDFGCGGGFLLKNLDCREKIGVEINPAARDYCKHVNRITCVESLELIQDESIDVVISSHCLEHTINPFELVSILFEKLKTGGKIVIVVPLENYTFKWTPHDINNHLYSFSPMNLGNILQGVGFTNIHAEVIFHKWVPFLHQWISRHNKLHNSLTMKTFHRLSWLYGKYFNKRRVQVRACGVKEK